MNNQTHHPDTKLVITLVIFIVGLISFSATLSDQLFSRDRGVMRCSEEALLCPNGSIVTRSGPQCSFAPCRIDIPLRGGITEDPFEVPSKETPTKSIKQTPPVTTLPETPKKEVACTQDAKMCPDGSFVGRIAPNCQFAPCPTAQDISKTGPASL